MKIIKQNIKLYKMAYKMDPTKKKNKNGGMNSIFKGIQNAAMDFVANFTPKKNQLPSIIKNQLPSVIADTKKPKIQREKMRATPTRAKNLMKKSLTNLKRNKISSVNSIRPEIKNAEPTGNATIKGNVLTTSFNKKLEKKKSSAKSKAKKIKVKIKDNKTKIKIKK